jgi:hypothetical protein
MDTKILDQVLLPLADQFEAGVLNRWFSLKPDHSENYEQLRECMAELFAEGSIQRTGGEMFRLTPNGYSKYESRIKALRALSSSVAK